MSGQTTRLNVRDEKGMAAILITMVIMVVIMLMVLGFATVSRREQRQSLDNQLQTQAFYAAESGVNDAKKIAAAAFTSGTAADKTSCTNDGIYSALKTNLGNPADNVSYSCVLVNTAPTEVTNTAVVDGSSWVVPVDTSPSVPTEFTIRWTPNPAQAGVPTGCNVGANNFTAATARTCKYPMLRVDLVDASSITGDPAVLNSRMNSYYFQPSTGSGGTTTFTKSGTVNATVTTAIANCTTASYGSCQMRITPGSAFTSMMAMRITSLYGQSSVTVRAGGLPIKNSQILIDSTGKAQDVLRRIQVRIPVQSSSFIPSYSAQSGTAICKRYTVFNGSFKVGNVLNNVASGGDPMCQPDTASGVTGTGTITGAPSAVVGSGAPSVSVRPYIAQAGHRYRYNITFTNTTLTNGLTIVSCTWYFGDGTTATTSCNTGDRIVHNYALAGDSTTQTAKVTCVAGNYGSPTLPSNRCTPTGELIPFPEACTDYPRRNEALRRYTIKVAVNFSNGTSQLSPAIYIALPACG